MASELVYTSATRGLRAGTSGFCTVAMTRGLPAALVPRLEALGGYRAGPDGEGPVARTFWRVETASGVAHVLAAVGPAPPDHTQRTNKIASYLILEPSELADAGPAWMLLQPGLLRERWVGDPAWLEERVRAPRGGPLPVRRCAAWEAACGDAGWAGVLASAFLRDQGRPVHVIYAPSMDPLALVDDAMHLLPTWARWRATFTTYFLQPVAGTLCVWRFCLEGSGGAETARQSKGLVIDLTRPLGQAPESRFVRMARSGIDPDAKDPTDRGGGTSTRSAAADAQRRALELEPEEEPSMEAAALGSGARPHSRALPLPEPAAEPSIVRSPVVIALAAAVVTMIVLGIVLVVVMGSTRSTPPVTPQAPTPEAPAVVQPVAPPVAPPDVPADAPPGVQPEVPAAVPPEVPPVTHPAQDQPPVLIEPAVGPALAPAVAPAPTAAPAPAWVAAPAPAPAPLPEVAFFGRVEAAKSADATPGALTATIDGPAGTERAEFLVPEFLQEVGVIANVDELNGGWPEMRARLQMQGRTGAVRANATQPAPAALVALFPEIKAGDATGALRALLSRTMVEFLDAQGKRLGVGQFRRPETSLGVPGVERKWNAIADPALIVQVLQVGAAEPVETARLETNATTLTAGLGVRVRLGRDRAKAQLSVQLDGPTEAEIGACKALLSRRITEVSDALLACSTLQAQLVKPGRATLPPVEIDRINRVMNAKERGLLTGADGLPRPLTEPAALAAVLPTLSERLKQTHDQARSMLGAIDRQKKSSTTKPEAGDLQLRVLGTDGFVYIDAPLRVVHLPGVLP